ncbi:MAG: penicillin-binding protein 2 [Bacteroidales bacterium]|nr:penicillin-binding protein 2 [Bacteroidales bacterium]
MDQHSDRKFIIGGIILLITLIILVRLFFLQVIDTSSKLSAENNSKRIDFEYPARGLIYDRNHKLLVYNQPAYDLMITPSDLKPFDTTELCDILKISRERMKEGIKNSYKKLRDPFIKQLSPETYAVLQERLFKFPGFYVKARTLRKYEREIASHLLGYVGEVDEAIIQADPNYSLGDYIGISGLEKSYEKVLRGEKGQKVYLVDVHSKVMGPFQGGRFDKDATVGRDIVCTIDADLQEYGEKLMKNYKGSVVALEPSTGEILAFISSPFYNPSLLIGRQRTQNYLLLQKDTLQPIFNRPLMANYPPGSTFKTINGLIGLQEKVISTQSEFYCDLGYYSGRVRVGCHNHHSPLDFREGIQNSCNAYFCNVFRRIIEDPKYGNVTEAFNNWRRHVVSFNLGSRLNSDFTNELPGFIPQSSYYDKYYGKNGWKALTIISLAIGQGEILVTPMQMANMTSIIANRGYYYIPHSVKEIQGQNNIDERFKEKKYTTIDTANFRPVIEGMYLAVNGGAGSTAYWARLPKIAICGKTGTAENPHGEDHSIFIAFAPKDDPKIALAVYVENAGFGSSYAAPIASLLIEKYLTDTITRPWMEQRLLETNLLYKN